MNPPRSGKIKRLKTLRFLFFPEFNQSDFRPDPNPPRIGMVAEPPVAIDGSPQCPVQACPVFVNILYGTPLPKTRNFNPELHAVRMSAQGKLEIHRMPLDL